MANIIHWHCQVLREDGHWLRREDGHGLRKDDGHGLNRALKLKPEG